jgi:uncharacterized protein YbaP (TraB family)
MKRCDGSRRVIVGVGFLLALAAQVAAQSNAIVPLLYAAERDATAGNGASVYYIYGSIHAAPPAVIPPPVVVREAFARSELLVTEIALTDDLFASLTDAMMGVMFLPEGESLRDLYEPDEWRQIAAWARSAAMPIDGIIGMQPWAVELIVAQTAQIPADFSAENGLDFYFGEKGAARGLRNLGLETVEDQLAMLSSASIEEQAESLLDTVRGIESSTETIELYDAWRRGDEEAIARIIEAGVGESGTTAYDALLTRRNRAWTEVLSVDFIDLEVPMPAFVVVGAAHLVGTDNLLDLLRDEGFQVRRILSTDDL